MALSAVNKQDPQISLDKTIKVRQIFADLSKLFDLDHSTLMINLQHCGVIEITTDNQNVKISLLDWRLIYYLEFLLCIKYFCVNNPPLTCVIYAAATNVVICDTEQFPCGNWKRCKELRVRIRLHIKKELHMSSSQSRLITKFLTKRFLNSRLIVCSGR